MSKGKVVDTLEVRTDGGLFRVPVRMHKRFTGAREHVEFVLQSVEHDLYLRDEDINKLKDEATKAIKARTAVEWVRYIWVRLTWMDEAPGEEPEADEMGSLTRFHYEFVETATRHDGEKVYRQLNERRYGRQAHSGVPETGEDDSEHFHDLHCERTVKALLPDTDENRQGLEYLRLQFLTLNNKLRAMLAPDTIGGLMQMIASGKQPLGLPAPEPEKPSKTRKKK